MNVETKGVKRPIFVSYPRGIASHNFIYVKDLFRYIKQKKPHTTTTTTTKSKLSPTPPPKFYNYTYFRGWMSICHYLIV